MIPPINKSCELNHVEIVRIIYSKDKISNTEQEYTFILYLYKQKLQSFPSETNMRLKTYSKYKQLTYMLLMLKLGYFLRFKLKKTRRCGLQRFQSTSPFQKQMAIRRTSRCKRRRHNTDKRTRMKRRVTAIKTMSHTHG